MGQSKVTENIFGLTNLHTEANFRVTSLMDMESMSGQMVGVTLETGRTIR
jgi:hypothetical protein